MFRDMKVATRLTLAFSIVLLLLLSVIVVGITHMQRIDHELGVITELNNVEIHHATEMQSLSLDIGNNMRDLLIVTDPAALNAGLEKIRSGHQAMEKEAAGIEKLFEQDEDTTRAEKDALAKIQTLMKEVQPLREAVAAEVMAN